MCSNDSYRLVAFSKLCPLRHALWSTRRLGTYYHYVRNLRKLYLTIVRRKLDPDTLMAVVWRESQTLATRLRRIKSGRHSQKLQFLAGAASPSP